MGGKKKLLLVTCLERDLQAGLLDRLFSFASLSQGMREG